MSREQYREQVGKALEFLNGNYNMVLKELETKMKAASQEIKLVQQLYGILYRRRAGVRPKVLRLVLFHRPGKDIGRGPAIDKMVTLISRFEYIVTDSELEALVLRRLQCPGQSYPDNPPWP